MPVMAGILGPRGEFIHWSCQPWSSYVLRTSLPEATASQLNGKVLGSFHIFG